MYLILILVAVLLSFPSCRVDLLHPELEHVCNLAGCKAALWPRQDGEALAHLQQHAGAGVAGSDKQPRW